MTTIRSVSTLLLALAQLLVPPAAVAQAGSCGHNSCINSTLVDSGSKIRYTNNCDYSIDLTTNRWCNGHDIGLRQKWLIPSGGYWDQDKSVSSCSPLGNNKLVTAVTSACRHDDSGPGPTPPKPPTVKPPSGPAIPPPLDMGTSRPPDPSCQGRDCLGANRLRGKQLVDYSLEEKFRCTGPNPSNIQHHFFELDLKIIYRKTDGNYAHFAQRFCSSGNCISGAGPGKMEFEGEPKHYTADEAVYVNVKVDGESKPLVGERAPNQAQSPKLNAYISKIDGHAANYYVMRLANNGQVSIRCR